MDQSEPRIGLFYFSLSSSLLFFFWDPFQGIPNKPTSLCFNFHLLPVPLKFCLPFCAVPRSVITFALHYTHSSPSSFLYRSHAAFSKAKSSYQSSMVVMTGMCPKLFIIYWLAPLWNIFFVNTVQPEISFWSSPNQAESLVDMQDDVPMGRQKHCYTRLKLANSVNGCSPWVHQDDFAGLGIFLTHCTTHFIFLV